MLMRYAPYEHSEQVQNQIFDQVFVSLEDQPRLTIEQLIERVKQIIVQGGLDDVHIRQNDDDGYDGKGETEEIIEDEYYDEEDENQQPNSTSIASNIAPAGTL